MRSMENLISASSVEFSADFGFIHSPNDFDIDLGLATETVAFLDTKRSKMNLFLTTRTLKKSLPDIYWITVFGKPYVDLFSKDRLLSAPAYQVRELGDGSILMKLFEDISSCEEFAYENRKKEVKRHISANAFFDLSKGTNHDYSTPKFLWGEVEQ